MSQLGKFLNLHPHNQSWGVYNENGPYTTAYKIGTLSPAQFGGLSYMILAEKGGDVYVIQTESFGRCAIWAPVDNDSNITFERTYSNGDNNGSGGGTVIPGTGKYLNLHSHMQSWAVYNENGPYTSASKIGTLSPAQFSGLSYRILEEKGGYIYIIQTESFGRCAIWAPRDADSSITSNPVYPNGDTSDDGSTGGGTGKYLNLHSHMQSWAVYNENGPYTTAYKIGTLAPAQYGGLSYLILEEKGGDVYVIQTESFGRCAIWAPRDADSSITSTPAYTNGNTSGDGSTGGNNNGGTGGVEIPGGLKVFIDPGHGGSDPGAIGNGLYEKNIVLSIAKKLGVILNSYGVSIQYSRTDDTFVDLAPRAQMANNWGASLFVSIHANAATATASGTECYTHPNDNSTTKNLSANVARSISNKFGIPNRGHKEEDFAVLRLTSMPAILVETAFITNSVDANLLKNRQDDFANAIANEILNYLGISSNIDTNELLKYASNTGLFAGSNIEVGGLDLKSPIKVLSLDPPITAQAEISLTAKLEGPYNFIDLSASPDSLSIDLLNKLGSVGATFESGQKNLSLMIDSISSSMTINKFLKYSVSLDLAGVLTITLESTIQYKKVNVYQRLIIKVFKKVGPEYKAVTVPVVAPSSDSIDSQEIITTVLKTISIGIIIGATIYAGAMGLSLLLPYYLAVAK